MARNTLDALMTLLIPEIQKIFLKTMQGIVDDATLAQIIAAIESNDPEKAFKAIGFTPQALYPIIKAIDDAFEQGGYNVAGSFPSKLIAPDGSKFTFHFDMRNQDVEDYLDYHSSSLITRLTEEARVNVRSVLTRGAAAGNNPRTTALDIVGRIDPVTKKRVGGIIGLNANQEIWSANTRRDLNDLNSKYFSRELRDKRFDGIVKKAIADKTPLSEEIVSKIVTAYNNKALKYRADMIARTETIQAMNRAEFESYNQVIESGAVKESDINRHWDSAGDNRVRWSHKAMDKKYSVDGVGAKEPFISPSGAKMMYPGDTSLGADGDETIMCRCRVRTKVNWFANLKR